MVKRKLQVFVSSTYSDLIEERQAAVAAILKAGHIPAGMELFTAGDKSQLRTIERWIDESDVYMLILGGRYGSIEPTSGLSYTELEYDYATAQGKPSFSVVITEEALEAKVRLGGTQFIEKSNPKALEQFRQKVLSNISSFFSDAKDIKLCVYESLSDHATNPSLRGWIAADEVEDTKSLHEEIKKLREENSALLENLRKLESAAENKSKLNSDKNSELLKVLRAIEIKVPAKLAGGKELTTDLFSLSYNNKDTLINGITNHINSGDAENFFYFNILSKLQAHGLADNEKVPGARYRRSYLNKAGQAFFASYERAILLAKEKRDAEKIDSTRSTAEDNKSKVDTLSINTEAPTQKLRKKTKSATQ